jgi:hypothetical protein
VTTKLWWSARRFFHEAPPRELTSVRRTEDRVSGNAEREGFRDQTIDHPPLLAAQIRILKIANRVDCGGPEPGVQLLARRDRLLQGHPLIHKHLLPSCRERKNDYAKFIA